MLILGSDSENEDDGWREGFGNLLNRVGNIREDAERDEMARVNDVDDRGIVYVWLWRGIFLGKKAKLLANKVERKIRKCEVGN